MANLIAAFSASGPRGVGAGGLMRSRPQLIIFGLLLLLMIGLTSYAFGPRSSQPFDLSQATYVGRDKCIECHAAEVKKYAGSHHDLAMDRATPDTVLGDFSGVELTHLV